MTYDDDMDFAAGRDEPETPVPGPADEDRTEDHEPVERAGKPLRILRTGGEATDGAPELHEEAESREPAELPRPAEALTVRQETGPELNAETGRDEPSPLVRTGSITRPADRTRLGIVGGKGVGKSYLFQGMVYRTQAGSRSGALSYYLERDSIDLFSYAANAESTGSGAGADDGRGRRENLEELLRSYESWTILSATRLHDQRWYELRLGYRCGLFGGRRATLDVEFLDGSGEGFFEAGLSEDNLKIWRAGFVDTQVMVFCLPLWVAFPRPGLTDEDWEEREKRLAGFQRVLTNYNQVREEHGTGAPVKTILALTMADDGRSALDTLRARWIDPYMDRPGPILKMLRRSRGVARYLANARRISAVIREELEKAPESRIARLPNQLDLGAGEPWMIPLSAVDGSRLDLSQTASVSEARLRLRPPVPVHVELPLLVTLCERANALM